MKDCEKYQERISAVLDGELTEAEASEVLAHIAVCPECGAMYAAFRAVGDAISDAEVPDSLHSGIMEKVNAAAKAKKTQQKLVRLRPILATAACLAVIVGTVFALQGNLGRMKNAEAAAPAAADAPMMMAANSTALAGSGVPKEKGAANRAEAYFAEAQECAPAEAPVREPEAAYDSCATEESEAKPLPSLCLRIETIHDTGDFTATVTKPEGSPFAEGDVLRVEMDEATEPIAFNLVEGGEYRVLFSEIAEAEFPRIHAAGITFP